ncbi:MAG: hypothetical protein AAF570_00645 [Bacteroidota bacterium]
MQIVSNIAECGCSLYDQGFHPPPTQKMHAHERYVGTTYDESGLQFYLLYDSSAQHLYWLLNEETHVPETFYQVSDRLWIGKRTEFAFYVKDNRKILVGVERDNVYENTWFDGPFDQLPDNYIAAGQLDLRPYLEACYPEVRGEIDIYGNYTDEPGTRVAISNYSVYHSPEKLKMMVEKADTAKDATTSQRLRFLTWPRHGL